MLSRRRLISPRRVSWIIQAAATPWPEEEAAPAEATTTVVVFGGWDPRHIIFFEWNVIA